MGFGFQAATRIGNWRIAFIAEVRQHLHTSNHGPLKTHILSETRSWNQKARLAVYQGFQLVRGRLSKTTTIEKGIAANNLHDNKVVLNV
jgi:hypothetical protein